MALGQLADLGGAINGVGQCGGGIEYTASRSGLSGTMPDKRCVQFGGYFAKPSDDLTLFVSFSHWDTVLCTPRQRRIRLLQQPLR